MKIDETYTTRPKFVDEESWKIRQSDSTSEVTKKEERVLLLEIEGLLKDDILDTRFQDLLGITEKMDNLFVALAFASHDETKELSTGPWNEEQFATQANPRVILGKKPPNQIADKLTGPTIASMTTNFD